ncbi:MAG: TrmO family methyltransferase [Marinisporobacter sp.]|jgi:tRNA-Thr(GGU) m(6)t(6)A37 methyltransferase TsaA|nr:TrmO family methyltransferase [Marinisporobacter sp.]
MEQLYINPIGKIAICDDKKVIILKQEYILALTGLDEFGYIQVLWWFNGCDNIKSRLKLTEKRPYKNGPEILGTFATRSPERPNPIALTTAYVTHIDFKNGIIHLAYIDADEGSPIVDIKPYTPSLDRVESILIPSWCENWPKCNEESGKFDWSSVFNF